MYAFIRHGQTDWNRDDLLQGSSDIPLNAYGRDQAHGVARSLATTALAATPTTTPAATATPTGAPWSVVVSSPLRRARETARLIADDLGIVLGPSYDELRERDYGALEGTNARTALAAHPDRDYRGAESLKAVTARGLAALDRVFSDFGDVAVVIVAHGTIIRCTLAALSGAPVDDIPNGSVSMVWRVANRWRTDPGTIR